MIIAISGTPGCGKTAAAKLLAKHLSANLISISSLTGIKHGWDGKRKTRIIDAKDLQKAVNRKTAGKKINIVEGHMAHLLCADVVVVLRCNPQELEKRLKGKGYSKAKVIENVHAEILDEIIMEAMQKHRLVFEIDTTGKSARQTAAVIKKILNNLGTKDYSPGKIDWSEKYKDYLTR